MYQRPMTAVLATARAALAALLLSGAALAGAMGVSSPAAAADGAFLPGLGDVPVMPGLSPVKDGSLVFDKPGGRIAEAIVRGVASRSQVEAFYADALPPLGWRRAAAGRFTRETEELRMEFLAGPAGATTVRFILIPR